MTEWLFVVFAVVLSHTHNEHERESRLIKLFGVLHNQLIKAAWMFILKNVYLAIRAMFIGNKYMYSENRKSSQLLYEIIFVFSNRFYWVYVWIANTHSTKRGNKNSFVVQLYRFSMNFLHDVSFTRPTSIDPIDFKFKAISRCQSPVSKYKNIFLRRKNRVIS